MRGKGLASCQAACSVGVLARPGRETWPLPQTSCRQPTISPCASRSASRSTACAAPNGAQASSSSRDHSRLHRPALHRARQQRRLQGHVVGAVLAVAAGALDVLDDDALRRQARRSAPGRHAGCRRPGCASRRARLPSDHCAMAQEGAIDACAMNGREYSRRRVRDLARRTDRRLARVDRRGLDRLALDPGAQVGLVRQRLARCPGRGLAEPRRRAARAASSVSATTPTKLPSRTTATTPGTPCAAASSSAVSVAPGDGGRSTRPCSMPGSTRSWMKRGRPNTLSGMSRRAAAVPADAARGGRLGRDLGRGIALEQVVARPAPSSWCADCRGRRSCRPAPRGSARPRPAAARPRRDRWRAPPRRHSAAPSPTARPTGCPR